MAPTTADRMTNTNPTAQLAHQADRHLERIESEFLRMKELLRRSQRLASLGTAAAMLAHEYNNLFTPVVGYAQHALDKEDPDLMRLALGKVVKQSEIICRMSDRILGLAVERNQMPASCPVRTVVDDALGCLGRELPKDRITLVMNVDDDIKVRANAHQLEQILFNLITNARQAMLGSNGKLTIEASRAGEERVRICVRDSGPGIAPENIEQIFDPFFTTKQGGRKLESSGIGLGLYICRELIEDNGGSIDVESQPGEGATFIIELAAGD